VDPKRSTPFFISRSEGPAGSGAHAFGQIAGQPHWIFSLHFQPAQLNLGINRSYSNVRPEQASIRASKKQLRREPSHLQLAALLHFVAAPFG
jgi:hypothetical protein